MYSFIIDKPARYEYQGTGQRASALQHLLFTFQLTPGPYSNAWWQRQVCTNNIYKVVTLYSTHNHMIINKSTIDLLVWRETW